MKSLFRSLVAGGFVAATAVVLSTACVDERASLYIGAVMLPQPPQCTFTADPTAVQLLRGTLDVAIKRNYNSVLLVGNQLTPRGEKLQARAETMRTVLTSAEVTLLDAAGEQLTCDGNEDCGAFSVFGEGVISVNRSEEPAFGLFGVQLIPDIVGQSIGPQVEASGQVTIVARVKVFGETLGGQEVESAEFVFPIDVCFGCLVTYNQGPCCALEDGDPAQSCRPGQDGPVLCWDRANCRRDAPGEVCDRKSSDTSCPGDPPP